MPVQVDDELMETEIDKTNKIYITGIQNKISSRDCRNVNTSQVPVDHVDLTQAMQISDVTHSQLKHTGHVNGDINNATIATPDGDNQTSSSDVIHSPNAVSSQLGPPDFPEMTNTSQPSENRVNSANSGGDEDVDNSQNINNNFNFNSLRLLIWNSEGLLEKINLDGFCDFINSFDIIGLGETFTKFNFDFSIKFKEFDAIHCPAEQFSHLGRPSGGLVLLVKKTLKEAVEIIETGISHVLSIKIKKEFVGTLHDLLYINTYVHPVGSVFYSNKEYQNTLEEIEQFILDQTEGRNELDIILGGDLNARVGDWSFQEDLDGGREDEDEEGKTYRRKTQDQVINNYGKRLIEICTMFGLTPLGGLKEKSFDSKHTFIGHRGSSHIDHFVVSTNLLDKISSFKIVDRIESSHLPITLTLNCKREEEKTQHQEKKISKTKWQEDKVEECREMLMKDKTKKDIKQAEQMVETDIDGSLQLFNKIMKKVNNPMKKNFKINTGKTPPKKWFDKECQKQKTSTKKQLAKLNRVNAQQNPEEYQQEKTNYLEKKVEYHRLVREKRKEFNNQTKKQILNDIKDSKKFWKRIKTLSATRPQLPNITILEWEEHFKKVHNPEESNAGASRDEQINETLNQEELVMDEELDAEISQEEIKLVIDKLKAGKAAGLDEIGPELIKLAEPGVRTYLCKLFNKIYDSGYFPIEWAKAIIVPLLKKGDVTKCDNYRGISLLSVVSKIFTAIINKRLYRWAEENSKISEEQAGFRKSYSTTDHIYTLYTMVNSCLFGSRRSKLYVAFIDYRKAFDTVRRETLWQILKNQKVPSKVLKIIESMYRGVKVIVRFGNELSNEIGCPLGVRQGCLLSPLLFSLLITEVAKRVAAGGRAGYQLIPGAREIFSLLFADDIVLIAKTPAGLQNQINNLRTASTNIGLEVNLEKTKVMVFRKGGYLGKSEKWHYGREQIEVVNSYKYLGFTFTTKLSIDTALAEFAGRAKKKIVIIFKTLYKLGQIDIKTFFQLFDVQIKPMLLYAAEIWGATQYEIIEKTHMFACKKLLGVSARTPNTFIYAELNRYPLFIDSQIRTLKYWKKTTSSRCIKNT